ncbi:MAG: SRPBCC domain-containing protein [Actinobacteria bacterium]|nr:SRPBCC domain-containing protein [Dehalococcoidia bacterium]MCB0872316.1 SRPBCC domain-containing protein [Thermoleophilia bacterium]MCB9010370.1 SRPBCC domain-containing protein [Actinomycetota bacterium]
MNSDLDLVLRRVIRAPRATVWEAWTDPASLEEWWLPAPMQCRVERFEPRPGGAFVTSMSEDGQTFVPHFDGCVLVVDEPERLVFTNGLDSQWRPATPQPVAMTAVITLLDHPDGTDYGAVVRHGDPAARELHEQLGFLDGWGAVTEQLAAIAERRAGQ